MKITELKCKSCNGSLRIDEENPHIAVCEYCNTTYAIEADNNDDVHFSQSGEGSYSKSVITVDSANTGAGKGSRFIVVVFCVLLVGVGMKIMSSRHGETRGGNPVQVTVNESDLVSEKTLSGPLGIMAETVLGRPAKELTPEELSSIKWLSITYDKDDLKIGYSLNNPYENSDAQLTWLSFPKDNEQFDYKLVSRFTGLKKLEMGGYLNQDALKDLSLEGISCTADSPAKLAEIYPGVSGLKEVEFTSGVYNLDGLEQYKNLEGLTFNAINLKDIKSLVSVKSLKKLSITNGDNINDFSVLSVLPEIQTLSLESEMIRDLSFIAALSNLKIFSLKDAKVLSVDDLKSLTGLTSLTINNCNDLTDLSGIEGLLGLKELSLEIPSNCPQPDLTRFFGITKLNLIRAADIGFLSSMTSLEELTLDRCKVNNQDVFASLTNLKKLTCGWLSGSFQNLNFVSGIPSLTYLNVSGLTTYEDISNIFLVPSIQEIYLNGVECELDFDKVQPSETLKVLEMDGIKLYKNVKVSGGNGIYSVDYDKVALDEHKDFLMKFPGLKKLSLADNTLTGIDFAASLPALEELNISGNYVTDLKPLQNLSQLKKVICTNNPIGNDRVLSDHVSIIK
jgi:hypothetical protein